MQQGIEYARLLDVPFVFATNGDGFIFRDATVADGELMENRLPSANPFSFGTVAKIVLIKSYTEAQLR